LSFNFKDVRTDDPKNKLMWVFMHAVWLLIIHVRMNWWDWKFLMCHHMI